MHGRSHDLRHRALLYQHALLHHRHAVSKAAHQIQVMGNQEHSHAGLALQIAEQIQNLAAQGYVERGCGLIGQQQLGAAGQRHGDHGALALPAAELVGIAVCPASRLGDAGCCQQLDSLFHGLRLAQALFELQHLGNLGANGQQRVQRRHGLLKNHGDIATAHGLHLALIQ